MRYNPNHRTYNLSNPDDCAAIRAAYREYISTPSPLTETAQAYRVAKSTIGRYFERLGLICRNTNAAYCLLDNDKAKQRYEIRLRYERGDTLASLAADYYPDHDSESGIKIIRRLAKNSRWQHPTRRQRTPKQPPPPPVVVVSTPTLDRYELPPDPIEWRDWNGNLITFSRL